MWKKEMLWRVGLYIRLSRDDGNDESLSVANQRKLLTEFLEDQFAGEYVLAGVYIDDGQSGTDQDRPEFRRLTKDAEEGRINCVLCKNLSRAFRNYADQGYFLESFFPRHGIRFVTLGDPKVDTFLDPEATTGLEVPISGLLNDRFACRTSGDIRRTFDMKRRKGEFIGAFAPYGYRKDPEDKNRLVPDPEAAQVVREMFWWYAEGMSKEGIARRLNGLGILSPAAYKRACGFRYRNPKADGTDGLWQGSAVAAILSNEVYAGTMVQGRQRVVSYKIHDRVAVPEEEWYRVPGTHEPLVSGELYGLAQKLRGKGRRSAPGTGRRHLFSGLLRCADCKKAMTRKPSKQFVYYQCSTYRRKSRDRCSCHSIRLDVLEETVLAAVQRQIGRMPDRKAFAEELRREWERSGRRGRRAEAVQRREEELERAERLALELYLDWKKGVVTDAQYGVLKERLGRQEEKLREAVERLKEENERIERAEEASIAYFLEHRTVQRLTQGLLERLIEEIEVEEGGNVVIRFRFRDPAEVGHPLTAQ